MTARKKDREQPVDVPSTENVLFDIFISFFFPPHSVCYLVQDDKFPKDVYISVFER